MSDEAISKCVAQALLLRSRYAFLDCFVPSRQHRVPLLAMTTRATMNLYRLAR